MTWAIVISLFVGFMLGMLAMGLCAAARDGDGQP